MELKNQLIINESDSGALIRIILGYLDINPKGLPTDIKDIQLTFNDINSLGWGAEIRFNLVGDK